MTAAIEGDGIVRSGQQIAHYRFVNRLGIGTTSEVWRVELVGSNPLVSHAAKVVLGSSESVYSSRQEAERMNEIRSKHVVQLVEFRPFVVVDPQTWQALGRPRTAQELRTALVPWRDQATHGGHADPRLNRCAAYARQVFSQSFDVPDPVLVSEIATAGALLVQTLCSETLEQHWIASGRSLPETAAVEIVAQVVEALRAVHSAPGRRPHLDVKMDNIFSQDGVDSWLLGDLGLGSGRSRLVSGERAPWFLALPDFRAHRTSDIWLVGVLLHQLMTGLLPLTFSGVPLQAIPANFYYAARELSQLRSEYDNGSGIWIHPMISDGVRGVLARCLALDHRQRPSADELREALGALVDLRPSSLPVGRHLESGDGVTVSVDDAVWVLGCESEQELEARRVPVVDGRVDARSLLAAEPRVSDDDAFGPDLNPAHLDGSVGGFVGSGESTPVRPYTRSDDRRDDGTAQLPEEPPAAPTTKQRPSKLLQFAALALTAAVAIFAINRLLPLPAESTEDGQVDGDTPAGPAAVGNLGLSWVAVDGSIELRWSPIVGAEVYEVYWSKELMSALLADATSYSHRRSVGPGKNYLVELAAIGPDGSPLVRDVIVVTAEGVDEFAAHSELNTRSLTYTATATTATVEWSPIGTHGYSLFLDDAWLEDSPQAVDETTYEFTNLEPATNYLVEVRTSSIDENGDERNSERVPLVISTAKG